MSERIQAMKFTPGGSSNNANTVRTRKCPLKSFSGSVKSADMVDVGFDWLFLFFSLIDDL